MHGHIGTHGDAKTDTQTSTYTTRHTDTFSDRSGTWTQRDTKTY